MQTKWNHCEEFEESSWQHVDGKIEESPQNAKTFRNQLNNLADCHWLRHTHISFERFENMWWEHRFPLSLVPSMPMENETAHLPPISSSFLHQQTWNVAWHFVLLHRVEINLFIFKVSERYCNVPYLFSFFSQSINTSKEIIIKSPPSSLRFWRSI